MREAHGVGAAPSTRAPTRQVTIGATTAIGAEWRRRRFHCVVACRALKRSMSTRLNIDLPFRIPQFVEPVRVHRASEDNCGGLPAPLCCAAQLRLRASICSKSRNQPTPPRFHLDKPVGTNDGSPKEAIRELARDPNLALAPPIAMYGKKTTHYKVQIAGTITNSADTPACTCRHQCCHLTPLLGRGLRIRVG